MKSTLIAIMCFCYASLAGAGDDASGPIEYSADFSVGYDTYEMTEKDIAWSRSLIKNLKYKGKTVHFVKTTIPLKVDGQIIMGSVYKAIEEKETFYVINGDTKLRFGTRWPYNPGVGGFSMHAPKSRNFTACLNFQGGGVPHLSSTPVKNGKVEWQGHEWRRIK